MIDPRDGSGFLRANWPAPGCVRGLTTLRHADGSSAPPFDDFNLGARCGDRPDAVGSNRALLRRRLQLPGEPRWLRQVHGIEVHRAGTCAPADEPEADAAITAEPGVVLAILTADCLPVLFCDRAGTTVAAAHAGWRGLLGGVLEATIDAFGRTPGDLLAWIGPGAGGDAYEVGVEVHDAFVSADAGAVAAFRATRPGHWLCDLPALARRRLQQAGMVAIHGGEHCTISDAELFFSHRRDGRSGRMASLIWINDGSD